MVSNLSWISSSHSLFFHTKRYHRHCVLHDFVSFLARPMYLFIFSLTFIFGLWFPAIEKSTRRQVYLFLSYNTKFGFRPRLGDQIESQCPKEFYASHFLGHILRCAYTFYLYGQILVACAILSVSLFPFRHTYSYISFELVFPPHSFYENILPASQHNLLFSGIVSIHNT